MELHIVANRPTWWTCSSSLSTTYQMSASIRTHPSRSHTIGTSQKRPFGQRQVSLEQAYILAAEDGCRGAQPTLLTYALR